MDKRLIIRPLIVSPLVILVVACGQSSTEKLSKALKAVQSWTATAEMVGEAWMQGSVPTAYAQQTLEKTQQAITQETEGLTQPTALPQEIQQLQHTLQQMTTAVKQNNKSAIAQPLQQLASNQQQLEALSSAEDAGHE